MVTFKDRDTQRARELRNAATPAERELWRYISRRQLGVRFNRQIPVGPYFTDFLCRAHRLAIELDGFSHDIAPEKDRIRDRYLQQAGYRVMHFTNEDVMSNAEGVVEVIKIALRANTHP